MLYAVAKLDIFLLPEIIFIAIISSPKSYSKKSCSFQNILRTVTLSSSKRYRSKKCFKLSGEPMKHE